MRVLKKLLLFSFCWVSVSLFAQTPNSLLAKGDAPKAKTSTTELSRKLERKFKRDAARLALRMEADKEELRYQNIIISPGNVESIYQALVTNCKM